MNPKRILAQRPDLLTESEFSTLVRDVARLAGWHGYHTFDSRKSNHGFPDWVFVHPFKERIVFAELKSETGRLSAAQSEWLEALAAIPNLEVHMWRPSDWDAIVKTLTGRKPAERKEQAA